MSIAVVIPAYNSGPYLLETLASVLNQTLPPDEVLVVDDGSTDDTAAVAEAFGPPVRVFRRSNQRQSACRNFAATQTQCDWLAFIDHDDLWEPHKLKVQIEVLARHPAAGLCYSARVNFVQQGETFHRGPVIPVPPASRIRSALYINTTFMPGSILIRRETYLANGGFNPNLKLVEDWDLWLRLLHAGVQFVGIQEPLLLMRLHERNQSNNALAALAEQKDIFRRLVLPHLPPATRWLAHQKSQSGQESAAAYVLRQVGDSRDLSMMATSIARYPLGDPHRYKVLAHMLYTRLSNPTPKP